MRNEGVSSLRSAVTLVYHSTDVTAGSCRFLEKVNKRRKKEDTLNVLKSRGVKQVDTQVTH